MNPSLHVPCCRHARPSAAALWAAAAALAGALVAGLALSLVVPAEGHGGLAVGAIKKVQAP